MVSNKPCILFVDDYPQVSENHLFVLRLRRAVAARVVEEKTVRGFEELLSRGGGVSIVVLDIMIEGPKDFKSRNGTVVNSALMGVELLRRCRAGVYGSHSANTPIFMRTARGEVYIRRLCVAAGATGFFHAGADDTALIEKIKTTLEEIHVKGS